MLFCQQYQRETQKEGIIKNDASSSVVHILPLARFARAESDDIETNTAKKGEIYSTKTLLIYTCKVHYLGLYVLVRDFQFVMHEGAPNYQAKEM